MIRLTYKHVCDRCGEAFGWEHYTLQRRTPLPWPNENQSLLYDLCEECEPRVSAALRTAMRSDIYPEGA